MAELIIALDLPSRNKALTMAERIAPAVNWLKVGLELFIASGPPLIHNLKKLGFNIFLDLKFYDIPNTVAHAVEAAQKLNVDILSLHCQGGERMCRAAAQIAPRPMLFGVTALTSFANGEMPGICKKPEEFGLELSQCAKDWGLDGVVCSGHEVESIKKLNPQMLCLCPGIRSTAHKREDQRRVVTPNEAVMAGADFLVVGRPVILASDPLAAALAITQQIRESNI